MVKLLDCINSKPNCSERGDSRRDIQSSAESLPPLIDNNPVRKNILFKLLPSCLSAGNTAQSLSPGKDAENLKKNNAIASATVRNHVARRTTEIHNPVFDSTESLRLPACMP